MPAANILGLFCPDDYGAVGDGSTNDTAAIQAAIDAALTAMGNSTTRRGGSGIWFTPGKNYRIAPVGGLGPTVDQTLASGPYSEGTFTIAGLSGASLITPACPGNHAFTLRGGAFDVHGIDIIGVPANAIDAYTVFYNAGTGSVLTRFRDLHFTGVHCAQAPITCNAVSMDIDGVTMNGCYGRGDLVAGSGAQISALVYNWLRIRNFTCRDYSVVQSAPAPKLCGTGSISRQVIYLGDCGTPFIPPGSVTQAFHQATAEISRVWSDENTGFSCVRSAPGAFAPLYALKIEDTQWSTDVQPGVYPAGVENTHAFEIDGCEHLTITRTNAVPVADNGPSPQRDAVHLTNVRYAKIKGCRFSIAATGPNQIYADATCKDLIIEDMEQGRHYKTLSVAGSIRSGTRVR